ncbi:MAG: GNAT family N-acetyltransferase [Bacteroidales bacterium]
MVFRDYRSGDYPGLSQLWEELDMSPRERGDTPEVIQQTISMGGKLIVMEEPGTGTIAGSSWMTFDGRRLFLHHFGIQKIHQRKDWGMKLAIESLKFVKEKGFQVKLEVHRENIAAVKLYEKCGFTSFPDYGLFMLRQPEEIDIEQF